MKNPLTPALSRPTRPPYHLSSEAILWRVDGTAEGGRERENRQPSPDKSRRVGETKSGGGPPHSGTLARCTAAPDFREASWSDRLKERIRDRHNVQSRNNAARDLLRHNFSLGADGRQRHLNDHFLRSAQVVCEITRAGKNGGHRVGHADHGARFADGG